MEHPPPCPRVATTAVLSLCTSAYTPCTFEIQARLNGNVRECFPVYVPPTMQPAIHRSPLKRARHIPWNLKGPTSPLPLAYLKLRTRISACISITHACSFAALSSAQVRACREEAFPAAAELVVPDRPPPPPPPGRTPGVFTRLLILMVCSVQMPILSITTGL